MDFLIHSYCYELGDFWEYLSNKG